MADFEAVQFDCHLLRQHGIAHLDDRFQHSGVEGIVINRGSLVLLRVLSECLGLVGRVMPECYLSALASTGASRRNVDNYRTQPAELVWQAQP